MRRYVIFSLAAVLLGGLLMLGQPISAAPAKARAARIAKALNLTADQKAKIKAIRSDAKARKAAVRADQSLTADAKKTEIKAIRQNTIAQVEQVLTPEQQAQVGNGLMVRKAVRARGAAKALGLTDDQKAQIKAIRVDARAQIKAVRADQSLAADARKAKVKEIIAAARAKALQVLTPDQQAKIAAARAAKLK